MAQNVKVCELDPDLQALLKKFRFRKEKTNAAIIMKIDKASMMVTVDEELERVLESKFRAARASLAMLQLRVQYLSR